MNDTRKSDASCLPEPARASHKILIIASDFPPLAGTNTQRVQSFVRHLPRFAWEASVITRSVEDMPLIDASQLERLPPETRIRRIADPDVFATLRRRRGSRVQDVRSTQNQARTQTGAGPEAHERATSAPLRKALSLASEWVMATRKTLAYLPDSLAPWANVCAREGAAICRSQGISVVLASAPSYSCLVAGMKLAQGCGLPFIADFRDLWVGRPYRRVASSWHDWWDRRLERQVALGAQRIILASPAWTEHFRQCYGEAVAEKCVVITNGYDEELIPERSPAPATIDGVKTFLNTGAMYGAESPAPFIFALGKLLQRRPELRSRIRVRLIGYAGDEESKLYELIKRHELAALVTLSGPQAHDTCLQAQQDADVLLLFSASEHIGTLRGKSFEYLSTGKPILALIPAQGTQAEILSQAGTAEIIEYGNIDRTERAIESMLDGDGTIACAPNWDYIRQFERKALTGKLALTLDELVSSAS